MPIIGKRIIDERKQEESERNDYLKIKQLVRERIVLIVRGPHTTKTYV
jgi:hypothetical protein